MIDIITGTAFDAPKRMHHREDEPALEFPSSVSSRRRNLLALRAQNWRAAKKSGPTAHDYVQDGLIAMWDGIENAGWGVHDAEATVWRDLVAGFEKTQLTNFVWKENSFSSSDPGILIARAGQPQYPAGGGAFFGRYNLGDSATFEICHSEPDSNKVLVAHFFNMLFEGALGYYSAGKCFLNCRDMFLISNDVPCPQTGTLSFVVGPNGGILHVDGAQTEHTSPTAFKKSPYPNRDYVLNDTTGDMYCVRVYSRALTAAEVAANYAVDQARFFTA